MNNKELKPRTIRKKMLTRPEKMDWKLENCAFVNAFRVHWSRSNPNSRLVLKPATGKDWVLSTYDSKAKKQHWEAEPFKAVFTLGETFVVLESAGNASVFIELDVDLVKETESSEDENTNTAQEAA